MGASTVAQFRARRRVGGHRRVGRSLAHVALVVAAWALATDVYASPTSPKPAGVVWWDPTTWHDTDDHDDSPAPTPSTSAAPIEREPPRSPSSVAAANARGMAGLMVVAGLVVAGVAWARYRARPEAAFLADLRAPVGKVLLGYAIDSEVERDADTVVFRATHVASGAPLRVCLVRPEHVGDRARSVSHDERARAWALDAPHGRRVREVLRAQGEIVIVLEA